MNRILLRTVFMCISTVCLLGQCIATEPVTEKSKPATITPEWKIPKVDRNSVVLDGSSEDKVWSTVPAYTYFFFPWEEVPAPKTSLKMCYDDEHLWFIFEVEDVQIVHPEPDYILTEKDRTLGEPEEVAAMYHDRVEIYLDTTDSMKLFYGMEMSPDGSVLDYSARFYRNIDFRVDVPGLKTAPKFTQKGYTVEGSLDMAELRKLNLIHEGRYLRAGFFRSEFSWLPNRKIRERWIAWKHSGSKEPDFHVPGALGWVELE